MSDSDSHDEEFREYSDTCSGRCCHRCKYACGCCVDSVGLDRRWRAFWSDDRTLPYLTEAQSQYSSLVKERRRLGRLSFLFNWATGAITCLFAVGCGLCEAAYSTETGNVWIFLGFIALGVSCGVHWMLKQNQRTFLNFAAVAEAAIQKLQAERGVELEHRETSELHKMARWLQEFGAMFSFLGVGATFPGFIIAVMTLVDAANWLPESEGKNATGVGISFIIFILADWFVGIYLGMVKPKVLKAGIAKLIERLNRLLPRPDHEEVTIGLVDAEERQYCSPLDEVLSNSSNSTSTSASNSSSGSTPHARESWRPSENLDADAIFARRAQYADEQTSFELIVTKDLGAASAKLEEWQNSQAGSDSPSRRKRKGFRHEPLPSLPEEKLEEDEITSQRQESPPALDAKVNGRSLASTHSPLAIQMPLMKGPPSCPPLQKPPPLPKPQQPGPQVGDSESEARPGTPLENFMYRATTPEVTKRPGSRTLGETLTPRVEEDIIAVSKPLALQQSTGFLHDSDSVFVHSQSHTQALEEAPREARTPSRKEDCIPHPTVVPLQRGEEPDGRDARHSEFDKLKAWKPEKHHRQEEVHSDFDRLKGWFQYTQTSHNEEDSKRPTGPLENLIDRATTPERTTRPGTPLVTLIDRTSTPESWFPCSSEMPSHHSTTHHEEMLLSGQDISMIDLGQSNILQGKESEAGCKNAGSFFVGIQPEPKDLKVNDSPRKVSDDDHVVVASSRPDAPPFQFAQWESTSFHPEQGDEDVNSPPHDMFHPQRHWHGDQCQSVSDEETVEIGFSRSPLQFDIEPSSQFHSHIEPSSQVEEATQEDYVAPWTEIDTHMAESSAWADDCDCDDPELQADALLTQMESVVRYDDDYDSPVEY